MSNVLANFSCREQIEAVVSCLRTDAEEKDAARRLHLLRVVGEHVSSSAFLSSASMALVEDAKSIAPCFDGLVRALLDLKKQLEAGRDAGTEHKNPSGEIDRTRGHASSRAHKEIEGALDALVALLPPSLFLSTLENLVTEGSEVQQRHAMELLGKRLDVSELFESTKRKLDVGIFEKMAERLATIASDEQVSLENRQLAIGVIDR